jgi:hypothetical protein
MMSQAANLNPPARRHPRASWFSLASFAVLIGLSYGVTSSAQKELYLAGYTLLVFLLALPAAEVLGRFWTRNFEVERPRSVFGRDDFYYLASLLLGALVLVGYSGQAGGTPYEAALGGLWAFWAISLALAVVLAVRARIVARQATPESPVAPAAAKEDRPWLALAWAVAFYVGAPLPVLIDPGLSWGIQLAYGMLWAAVAGLGMDLLIFALCVRRRRTNEDITTPPPS